MSHQIGNSADVAAVRKRQADRQKVQAPPDTPGNWLGWLAGGVTTTQGGYLRVWCIGGPRTDGSLRFQGRQNEC
jgi:hypothetical protein